MESQELIIYMVYKKSYKKYLGYDITEAIKCPFPTEHYDLFRNLVS